MKKILFAVIMLATTYTLSAQEPTIEKIKVKEDETKVKYSDGSKETYQATASVPVTIRTHFMTTHPEITIVTWERTDDWWFAEYTNENNRMIRTYYNTQPYYLDKNESFIVALPVLNTYVPEEVIASAIRNYGSNLYSISAIKTGENEFSYQVQLIKNGVSEAVLMDEEGVVFTSFTKK